MKFIAVSDTHSTFPILPRNAEFIVHCGDLLPNFKNASREDEWHLQRKWIENRIQIFKEWLDGRPLIYVSGNHDFYTEMWYDLTFNQIECHCINDKFLDFKGIKFYGFPWIPFIHGGFNFEATDDQMKDKLNHVHHKFLMHGMPDIFVAHSAIANVLDESIDGRGFGSTHIANMITYNWRDNLPKWYLHGHIHYSHGIADIFNMKVCNSATNPYLLEI